MAGTDTGIARRESAAVAQQDRRPADQVWSGKLTPQERQAVALICQRFQLDPFLGHVQILGGKLYVGIDGWLEIANRHPEFDGFDMRVLSREEKDSMLAGEDDVMFEAKVWRKDRSRPGVAFGRANKLNVAAELRGQKLVIEVAQARALRKALRGAFRVTEMEMPEDEVSATEDAAPARDYQPFWEAVKALGVSNKEAHAILGVNSVAEVDDLRVAYKQIRAHVQAQQVQERETPMSREEFLAAAYDIGFQDKADIATTLGLKGSLAGKPPAGTTWESSLAKLHEVVKARENTRQPSSGETDGTGEREDFPPVAEIIPADASEYDASEEFQSVPF